MVSFVMSISNLCGSFGLAVLHWQMRNPSPGGKLRAVAAVLWFKTTTQTCIFSEDLFRYQFLIRQCCTCLPGITTKTVAASFSVKEKSLLLWRLKQVVFVGSAWWSYMEWMWLVSLGMLFRGKTFREEGRIAPTASLVSHLFSFLANRWACSS